MYRNIAFVKKSNNNKLCSHMNMHKNISIHIYAHS